MPVISSSTSITGANNYMYGNIDTNTPVLTISNEEGTVVVGDYEISVKNLKTCLKVLHKMAREEYPEEFI